MRHSIIFKLFVGCCIALTLNVPSHAADKIKSETDPIQRIDVRYRLFKTENMWNFLELDTQTGRLWQIQFTVENDSSRIRLPINSSSLAPESKNGRFTLYPTNNMWNFMLVDQDNGRIWQAQFSTGDENRGIIPIPSDESVMRIINKLLKKPK